MSTTFPAHLILRGIFFTALFWRGSRTVKGQPQARLAQEPGSIPRFLSRNVYRWSLRRANIERRPPNSSAPTSVKMFIPSNLLGLQMEYVMRAWSTVKK